MENIQFNSNANFFVVQDKENIEIGELSQAVQKLKAIEDSLPTEIQLKSKEHKELLAKISQESKSKIIHIFINTTTF